MTDFRGWRYLTWPPGVGSPLSVKITGKHKFTGKHNIISQHKITGMKDQKHKIIGMHKLYPQDQNFYEVNYASSYLIPMHTVWQ